MDHNEFGRRMVEAKAVFEEMGLFPIVQHYWDHTHNGEIEKLTLICRLAQDAMRGQIATMQERETTNG